LPLLAAGRLLLAALLLADVSAGVYWKYYVVGLLIVSWLDCGMRPLTKGGDSQLLLILYSAISLTLLADTPVVAGYCVYFLTVQLCLAYFAAGFHKLRSPAWRNGSALPGILSTRVFGCPALAFWLERRRWVARWLSLAVIVWEVSFPVVLVGPPDLVLSYLASGVLFHLSTALAMGLNKFIWAFFALYPAAIYGTLGSLAAGQ
jgi:hypothetical protein